MVAGIGFRMITQRGGSDQDSTSNFPKQEPRAERPLGDTPEAHDEINPHDLPLDHPGSRRGGGDGRRGNDPRPAGRRLITARPVRPED